MSTQLLNSHLHLKRRHVHNILILAFDMTTLGTLNQWEIWPFSYEKVTGVVKDVMQKVVFTLVKFSTSYPNRNYRRDSGKPSQFNRL